MPCGGGVGAGPFHSQTNEAWFYHTPGLKIVYPSNPIDAKGLLLASFEDPNPVLFFEHKALYRNSSSEVPANYYTTEIGKAKVVRSGNNCTIITYGMGVLWAEALVEKMITEGKNADIEIIDLRSLKPIDYNCIENSVKKTNRVLLLHEDIMEGGIGGDLSAYIGEHMFEYLDAPIIRCGSMNTPFPFAQELEKEYLANFRLEEKLNILLSY
jgi:2-oxoisovalerate dehydrogenase E1 component